MESNDASMREVHGLLAALVQARLSQDGPGFNAVAAGMGELKAKAALAFAVGAIASLGQLVYGDRERFAAAVAEWSPEGMPPPEWIDG